MGIFLAIEIAKKISPKIAVNIAHVNGALGINTTTCSNEERSGKYKTTDLDNIHIYTHIYNTISAMH